MIISLLIALAIGTGFTRHTSAFDKEIALWLNNATMECIMLKDNPVDDQQILKNISELESEFKVLSYKYIDKPPSKYARDVNWKTYFLTLSENMVVVREQIEEKQFAEAAIYCANFSNTIGQMHKINGTTDLADLSFSWRMELKNTTDMYNTGNTAGYQQNLSVVENIYKKLVSMKAKRERNAVKKRYNILQQPYADWLKAIQAGNTEAMNVAYQKFMDGFAKPSMASF
jgi:hypothetical protein